MYVHVTGNNFQLGEGSSFVGSLITLSGVLLVLAHITASIVGKVDVLLVRKHVVLKLYSVSITMTNTIKRIDSEKSTYKNNTYLRLISTFWCAWEMRFHGAFSLPVPFISIFSEVSIFAESPRSLLGAGPNCLRSYETLKVE